MKRSCGLHNILFLFDKPDSFFTIAATIRRLHDMGVSGAPALLLCIPEPWFILVPLALLWPSAKAPFAGTRREANFGVITHGIVR